MKMYLETSEMVLNFCKFKRDCNISSSRHEQVCVCVYMKLHQAFTEKFHGANVEGLSSIKFLTGYYLMSILYLYSNMISGYKYTEYNMITLTQYNVIILFFASLNRF